MKYWQKNKPNNCIKALLKMLANHIARKTGPIKVTLSTLSNSDIIIDPLTEIVRLLLNMAGELSRRKKCSLFPLTSSKQLGRVGRHDFFLINFFSFIQRKFLIFILQTCSFLLFLL